MAKSDIWHAVNRVSLFLRCFCIIQVHTEELKYRYISRLQLKNGFKRNLKLLIYAHTNKIDCYYL